MFKNILIVLLVLALGALAWNPIIAPVGRMIGRVFSAAWQAARGDEQPVVGEVIFYTPEPTQLPLIVVVTATPEPTTIPAPVLDTSCYGVIDGSVVPYGPKIEFAADKINVVDGPAVVEWWTGVGGAGNEGMFYLEVGQVATLQRNTRGGYWTIEASSAMTAEEGLEQLRASHAHLVTYSQKNQHSYAADALNEALATCDWTKLEKLMLTFPKGIIIVAPGA